MCDQLVYNKNIKAHFHTHSIILNGTPRSDGSSPLLWMPSVGKKLDTGHKELTNGLPHIIFTSLGNATF